MPPFVSRVTFAYLVWFLEWPLHTSFGFEWLGYSGLGRDLRQHWSWQTGPVPLLSHWCTVTQFAVLLTFQILTLMTIALQVTWWCWMRRNGSTWYTRCDTAYSWMGWVHYYQLTNQLTDNGSTWYTRCHQHSQTFSKVRQWPFTRVFLSFLTFPFFSNACVGVADVWYIGWCSRCLVHRLV